MDIYIQELMKGHVQQNKAVSNKAVTNTDTLERQKNQFEIEIDKEIEAYIDTLDLEDADPEKVRLVSKEMKRAHIKAELQAQAKLPELTDQLTMAFKVLHDEAREILTETEFLSLQSDLQEADKTFEQMDGKTPITTNYKEILHLQDSTIDSISKVAVERFNQSLYAESLSLFVLLATLIPENADYWYRAGILASKCEKYELALRFFKAASTLNQDSIAPLIFSIDCYLKQNMEPEAKQLYSEIKQKSVKGDESNGDESNNDWSDVLSYYDSILN
jgi:tetratricopeptide (TPR) repeat protein